MSTHTHPCATPACIGRVPCAGTLERNHDGYPEVICDDYHLPTGEVADVRCEDCEEREA